MTPEDARASVVREAPEDSEPVDLKKTPKPGNKQRLPMTLEQQGLAMLYLPMARRLARPFKDAWAPYQDDFESAACLGLVEAAQSYDASKRVKFSTYAGIRIMGELRDAKRDMQLSGWRDSEDPPTVRHLGHEREVAGRVLRRAQKPVEKDLDARDTVENWVSKLPKTHSAACRLIYLEDKNQRESRAVLGRCKTRFQILHKESLALLNESFRNKNMTAHEDDLVKAPLTPRKKVDPAVPKARTYFQRTCLHRRSPNPEDYFNARHETQRWPVDRDHASLRGSGPDPGLQHPLAVSRSPRPGVR